jgi:hypothetical protein
MYTYISIVRIHVHQLGAGSALILGNRFYGALTADKWEIFCTYSPKQKQTNILSSLQLTSRRVGDNVQRSCTVPIDRESGQLFGVKVSEFQCSL